MLAYGLGAWPSGADLSSLEQLLAQLGLTQAALRTRFESAIAVATAKQNRAFRELAGASFVLGAAARRLRKAFHRLGRSRQSRHIFADLAIRESGCRGVRLGNSRWKRLDEHSRSTTKRRESVNLDRTQESRLEPG
jgi:hypothetical protein